MLKADLHVHTHYSGDCSSPLEDIIEYSLLEGINCLNICDHNTIEGALKVKEMAPFKVIVSEEIETPEGEVMGLFLSETIPAGLLLEEAVEAIKSQNGLVCVPHPFEMVRSSAMKAPALERIKHMVDIIEVRNAKTWPIQKANKPLQFAVKNNLRCSAGSDAHTVREIGNYYVEMPEFSGPDSFLESLDKGKIKGPGTGFTTHFYSMACRAYNKICLK